MRKKTHCLLFSSGLDSTAILIWLLEKYKSERILALQFKVPTAQNQHEIKAGKEICKFVGVDRVELKLQSLNFGSSLMQKGNKKQ